MLLELALEQPVEQADEILCEPWQRGKGIGRLQMLRRGELAKTLLIPGELDSLLGGGLLGQWLVFF